MRPSLLARRRRLLASCNTLALRQCMQSFTRIDGCPTALKLLWTLLDMICPCADA